jgi:hypothetical protein
MDLRATREVNSHAERANYSRDEHQFGVDLDLHSLSRRAVREAKTVALAAAMIVFPPIYLLLILFSVGLSIEFYKDTRDHFFCAADKQIQSDEMAIDAVQKSDEVKYFLENYPEVSLSDDWVKKRRQVGPSNRSRGLWYVSREKFFPYHDVITVSFDYDFIDPPRTLAITCSMRPCNPQPDCYLLEP